MQPAPGVFIPAPLVSGNSTPAPAGFSSGFAPFSNQYASPPGPTKEEVARKTLEFQKKRAEAGAAHAQYDLGVRYLKGDGVEKDLAAARKWLTAAANSGNSQALKKLEELNKTMERLKEGTGAEGPVTPPPPDQQKKKEPDY